MLLSSLLLTPLIGIFIILSYSSFGEKEPSHQLTLFRNKLKSYKIIAFVTSIVNLIISLLIFILFDFNSNQFQFVSEHYDINLFDIYLGVDGISIYFVLLTTILMPIALLSNWNSITENVKSYLIIILLLETLLLAVFLVLDILLFYIFFESILPPLFLLIGLFGSSNKVRASFYLFLYTLWGSLFLLLSILTISSVMGTTDFDALFKINFDYRTQVFIFWGIFLAFAVKTPTIFLNNWLLKAHVESPLGGSIILAGIVLKLSLYGIVRLILPILPKAYIDYTSIVYVIGVITIIYASFSTLRTTDIKELIAYSSVCHAAVYLIAVFSNTIQGIEGGIVLGLAHGFVSSGLFICAGGVLYDRTGTRSIHFYKGIAQVMPLFSILFFILALGNCGAPLTLNFIGEFMSLYGVFERLPVLGIFASSSIVFSAAYTIYMFNRIAFGGSFSKFFKENISDLTKREFFILFILVVFTVVLGIYPSIILDGLHYSVTTLIYKVVEGDPFSLYSALLNKITSRPFSQNIISNDISQISTSSVWLTTSNIFSTISNLIVCFFSNNKYMIFSIIMFLIPLFCFIFYILHQDFKDVEKNINIDARENLSFFKLMSKITLIMLLVKYINGIYWSIVLDSSTVLLETPDYFFLYCIIFYILCFILFSYLIYYHKSKIYIFKMNFKNAIYFLKKNKLKFLLIWALLHSYCYLLTYFYIIFLGLILPADSWFLNTTIYVFSINIFCLFNLNIFYQKIDHIYYIMNRVNYSWVSYIIDYTHSIKSWVNDTWVSYIVDVIKPYFEYVFEYFTRIPVAYMDPSPSPSRSPSPSPYSQPESNTRLPYQEMTPAPAAGQGSSAFEAPVAAPNTWQGQTPRGWYPPARFESPIMRQAAAPVTFQRQPSPIMFQERPLSPRMFQGQLQSPRMWQGEAESSAMGQRQTQGQPQAAAASSMGQTQTQGQPQAAARSSSWSGSIIGPTKQPGWIIPDYSTWTLEEIKQAQIRYVHERTPDLYSGVAKLDMQKQYLTEYNKKKRSSASIHIYSTLFPEHMRLTAHEVGVLHVFIMSLDIGVTLKISPTRAGDQFQLYYDTNHRVPVRAHGKVLTEVRKGLGFQ